MILREHLGLFLKVFIAGFLLAAGLGVPFVMWTLNAQIDALQEQLTTAHERRAKWEEETKRQTQVAEHYRERFFALTKTNGTFSSFTHQDLQDYALRMVGALREPLREHDKIINKLETGLWSGIHTKTNAQDLQKTLEDRSTAEWEAGQRCITVYNIRFKPDVLLLRREILSRIPAGNDVDQNGLPTDYWYDSPWNFYGFRKMVLDLERIARLLPGPKELARKQPN